MLEVPVRRRPWLGSACLLWCASATACTGRIELKNDESFVGSSAVDGGGSSTPDDVDAASAGGPSVDGAVPREDASVDATVPQGEGGTAPPPPRTPPKCVDATAPLPANAPTLSATRWTSIAPPPFQCQSTGVVFTQGMTIHPCNPALLYVAVDLDGSSTDPNCAGVFHSEDGGATWRELGAFDSPVNVRVDPEDPLHLYVCDGVRGGTNGFWVSHDGGATWAMPDGFKQASQAVGSSDVYHVEPDPTDFNHVLLTFHSPWHGGGASGVLESFDGGTTFKIHEGLEDWAWAYGYDVFFLYEPQLGIGDPRTWLFGTQGKGYWRTTDAGEHWTKVSNENMRHGGGTVYYTRDGVLYVSGDASILRSTDNGVTFTSSVPAQFSAYLSVIGDGKNLWTGNHGGGPFLTAPESAPDSWKPFNDQQFKEGPFQMAHDKQHQILYSANASGGVWALKLQ